jgi:hypothetical protein
MDNKKAQSAIEFMIIVGAVVFFAVAFLGMIQLNISDRVREQRDILIKDVAFIVQDEISLAHGSIDGYSRNFTLPPKISGAQYGLNITHNWIFIATKDGRHAAGFPVLNVTGAQNPIILSPGTKVNIRKDNGMVCIDVVGDCPPS